MNSHSDHYGGNSSSNMLIIILLIILLNNLSSVETLPNQQRWAHAASLVNNNLYIYGGRLVDKSTDNYNSLDPNYDTDEILCLNVSVGFDPTNPQWNSITGIAPPLAFHSMSIGGKNNELLVIFGGTSKFNIPKSPLYMFNTTSNTTATNNPTTVGVQGSMEQTSITKYNNSMLYIFGGTTQVITNPNSDNTTNATLPAFNNMYIFDSISLKFSTIPPSNNIFPSGVYHHSSTLLNDKIYVIGGADQNNNLIPMGSISVFDTTTNQWSIQNATGATIPTARRVHRAVGTKDNKIIIYGGCNKDYSVIYNDLIVFDTTTLSWSTPTVQGTAPPAMYAHSMTMVGTNVIVAYGFLSAFNATTTNLYILDSLTYTWMSTYTPKNLGFTDTRPTSSPTNNTPSTNSIPSSSSSSSSSSNQTGVIVGSIIGSLVGIVLILALVFFVYKRKRRSFFTKSYEQTEPSSPPILGSIPYNMLSSHMTPKNDQGSTRNQSRLPFISKPREVTSGSNRSNTNADINELMNNSPSNVQSTSPKKFSVLPYLENPYYTDNTYDIAPAPMVNPTSSSSLSLDDRSLDYDHDNKSRHDGVGDDHSQQLYIPDDDNANAMLSTPSRSSSVYAPSPSRSNTPIPSSIHDKADSMASTASASDKGDIAYERPLYNNEHSSSSVSMSDSQKAEAFSLRSAQKFGNFK